MLNQCMKPLKNMYRHCILKLLGRLRHAQLNQSHHYSLTRCVCPGKGAVQEEKQKQIMECEMTNTLQLTTHTYISTTCTLHNVPPYIYMYYNLLTYKPTRNQYPSMFLSPTSLYHIPHIKVLFTNYGQQECN